VTDAAQTTAAEAAGNQQVNRKASLEVSRNPTHEAPQKQMYHWPQD
jgi:uncharacterized protein (DUF3084 family)